MKSQHQQLVESLVKLRNELNYSHNTVCKIKYGPIG